MAFTDYSISQSFDPAEEEHKRKEQELLASQQNGLPAQGPISPDQIGQLPELPQLPQAGEATQVAGPTQLPPQVQQTPALTPQAQQQIQQNTVPFQQALTESQGDQKKMWEIYNSSQYTPEQRQIAGAQLSDIMRQEYEKNKATQYIKSATPEDLTKMLNARSQEGSWGKAIMYGLLGMENSARDEAAKLGVGAKWQTQQVYDDKTGTTSNVLYKVRADGLPMEGYNADTGEQLSSKQLAGLAGGGQKLDMVGGTYVNDKTGEVGRVVSDKTTGQSWIQTSKGRQPMTGWRPQSSMGTMEDMRSRAIQELNIKLAGKTMEEKMAILRPYNQDLVKAGQRPVDPTEIGISTQQVPQNFNQRPMQQPGVQVQPAPQMVPELQQKPTQVPGRISQPVTRPSAPVAPVPLEQQPTMAPAPSPFSNVNPQIQAPQEVPQVNTGLGGRPTGAELKGREHIVNEAAKQVATSADTQNMLNSITKVEQLLDSGKHNVGSELSVVAGRGPIAQAIGSQFETTDAKNTKLILDTVNKLAADGMKLLGSNPSTADLKFWTENKPNGATDPEVMKEWIKSRAADLKRRMGYAEKQMGAGGGAGLAPETTNNQPRQDVVYPEKTINGVTYIYDGKGWKKK